MRSRVKYIEYNSGLVSQEGGHCLLISGALYLIYYAGGLSLVNFTGPCVYFILSDALGLVVYNNSDILLSVAIYSNFQAFYMSRSKDMKNN